MDLDRPRSVIVAEADGSRSVIYAEADGSRSVIVTEADGSRLDLDLSLFQRSMDLAHSLLQTVIDRDLSRQDLTATVGGFRLGLCVLVSSLACLILHTCSIELKSFLPRRPIHRLVLSVFILMFFFSSSVMPSRILPGLGKGMNCIPSGNRCNRLVSDLHVP